MSELSSKQHSMSADEISVELSSNRTAMSFSRTAMSSDRTLMSVVRTSLSLITFGFTIFQFFHSLADKLAPQAVAPQAPRRFGLALIVLGVVLLGIGIINHFRETKARRARRDRLFSEGLIRHAEPVTLSNIMAIAAMLLIIGLVAMIHVGLRISWH